MAKAQKNKDIRGIHIKPISPKKRNDFELPVIMALLILVITFIVFSPSLKNDFVNWDDQEYITDNPLVVNASLPIKEILTKPISGNYHPLTMFTLAWNYQAGKLNAWGYHAVNIIFHLLNTLLVFIFIYLLTRKNLLMACIVALFFGIHPVHVESVTWVSERKDVLYVFFFLGGLITYLYYRKSKKTVWYFVTLLLFVLSCLSKGMAVVFPVILLLLDYYLEVKWNRKTIIEKLPFFVFSICFGLITYHYQQQGLPSNTVIYSPFYKILFASYGAAMYIIKMFVPYNLSAYYPYPKRDNAFSSMLPFSLLLVGIIVMVYIYFRKDKAIVFGLLFYLVSVALVLQLITVGSAIIADRYTYLSYIGLLYVVAYVTNKAWTEKTGIFPALKYPLCIVIMITGIIFSFQTYARTKIWENGNSLWTDVLNNYPQFYFPYAERGEYFQNEGEEEKALTDFNRSLELNPRYSEAYNNRGLIYYKQKKFDLALSDYNHAIEYNIDTNESPSYFAGRALVFMRLNKNDKAQEDMDEAFKYAKHAPVDKIATLLVNRAFFYEETNQYQKAIADFTSYLTMKPDDGLIYNTRGLCFVKLNQINEAYTDFNKAVELIPTVPNYWMNRSLAENTLGKKAEALTDALKAKELGMTVDPNYLRDLGL